ncbi:hypothetical protein GSUET_35590 [Geobacter sulfurreducens subsp. ethanolicus]|nr:hypothetical protein GSUET_35590 [Geobacter sulfurreducens subsp. ethanolicus]
MPLSTVLLGREGREFAVDAHLKKAEGVVIGR